MIEIWYKNKLFSFYTNVKKINMCWASIFNSHTFFTHFFAKLFLFQIIKYNSYVAVFKQTHIFKSWMHIFSQETKPKNLKNKDKNIQG